MSNTNKHKELLVIDLGSYSLKMLVGKASASGITFKKARTIPISANVYANGDVQNFLELTSIVKDAVKDNGLRNFPTVFTFSSTSSLTRVLDVPSVKAAELKEIVEYEMQQFLPSDISSYFIQYKVLSEPLLKDGNLKVMVGTIPKSVAENFWTLAMESELVPIALDINTNALAKLLAIAPGINTTAKIAGENVALIEIGHSLMDISIFEQGEFQFNRRILMGGQNIDQRIEQVMEISIEEARMEKHNRIDINQEVFDYTDENRVLNSLKSGVDDWIAEIERVIKFYTNRKAGNKLDRCFIYGGGAGIMGIDKYMTRNLDVHTEVVHRLNGITNEAEIDGQSVHLFVNAMGALLRKEESKK